MSVARRLAFACVGLAFTIAPKLSLAEELWFVSDIIAPRSTSDNIAPDSSCKTSLCCSGDQSAAGKTANLVRSKKSPESLLVTTEANNCYDYDDAYTSFYKNWLTPSGFDGDYYWVAVPGNHDYMSSSGRPNNLAAAFHKIKGIAQGSPTGGVGMINSKWVIITINSELNTFTSPTMAKQIADLDYLIGETRVWHIPCQAVFVHRPAYSNATTHTNERLDPGLVEVLKRHRVELVLAGHEHVYERLKPIDGTVHIVAGTGGTPTSGKPDKPYNWSTTYPSAKQLPATHGAVRLELSDEGYQGEFWGVGQSNALDTFSGGCVL